MINFAIVMIAKTTNEKKGEAIVLSAGFFSSEECQVYASLLKLLQAVDSDYKPLIGFVVKTLKWRRSEECIRSGIVTTSS